MPSRTFQNRKIASIFDSYPPEIRKKIMYLRELIFDTAKDIDEVGELEETLKWGQPSYLTSKSKSGSLIRIDNIKSDNNSFAMYFHCQTNLIPTFRFLYSMKFSFMGNRAIVFNVSEKIPEKELKHCISLASYHLNKKRE